MASAKPRTGSTRPKRLIRSMAFLLAAVLMFNTGAVPAVFAVTVEEEAGRKGKAPRRDYEYDSDFRRKVPERREREYERGEKDPRLACLLSIIVPGGGHVYLNREFKGVAFCLTTVSFYGAAVYFYLRSTNSDLSETESRSNAVIAGVLLVIAAIFHTVGIVEAYNDAIDVNEKRYYYGPRRSRNPYGGDIEKE
ncbi:MAG TPA: hypothetical protein PLG31_14620 [Spirochaetota bacterium]|nr:hypothetical protein [Spirochaetota bacterium]